MNSAVVCIIENELKQVLLLRRNTEPMCWCLPGGKFDSIKESASSAIIRIVKAETGIDIHIPTFVKEDISSQKFKIYVFKVGYGGTKVHLSKEHTNFIWTDKILPELPLAGNTLSFLSDYKFDGNNLDMDDKLWFGKHANQTICWVAKYDYNYLIWLHENTAHKVKINIYNAAKKIRSDKEDAIRQAENAIMREESEIRYRKRNLEESVETPYGRAVANGGDYDLIDDEGNLTGKGCYWYFGWNKGSWTDDI